MADAFREEFEPGAWVQEFRWIYRPSLWNRIRARFRRAPDAAKMESYTPLVLPAVAPTVRVTTEDGEVIWESREAQS